MATSWRAVGEFETRVLERECSPVVACEIEVADPCVRLPTGGETDEVIVPVVAMVDVFDVAGVAWLVAVAVAVAPDVGCGEVDGEADGELAALMVKSCSLRPGTGKHGAVTQTTGTS